MENVLELKNVCKSFVPFSLRNCLSRGKSSPKAIHAVRDLSFEVKRSQIFGLIGPNGAGKSTAIKMITGLIKPDSGEIRVCGIDAVGLHIEAAKRLGALIEAPDLYPRMSGRENLRYLASLSGGVEESRIDKLLNVLSMSARADDLTSKYSLGMKQRIGIAQALLTKPDLLILDEPTNGLDPDGIVEIRKLLRRLANEYQIGILISSHILSEMELLCDKVGVMREGRLIAVEDAAALGGKAEDCEVIVRVDNPALAGEILKKEKVVFCIEKDEVVVKAREGDVPALTKALVMGGANVSGVNIRKRSLEETFSELIHGNGDGKGGENE